MASNKKFIPFNSLQETSEVQDKPKRIELICDAITFIVESSKLLDHISNGDLSKSREYALNLIGDLNSILNKIEEIQPPPLSGETAHNSVVEAPVSNKTINTRSLENGGMAPPKSWLSITELNLKDSDKENLIEEMRMLKENGLTVDKFNFHKKQPLSIMEFTEPFKYIEETRDYNGSFLITLLSSNIEISNLESTFFSDLADYRLKVSKGEGLILSVYDISGSASSGEEKKFLIILSFDKLNGTLTYNHSIFMNDKAAKLSNRQITEMKKFCKSKKITCNNI